MTNEMACMVSIIGTLLIFILGMLFWQVRALRNEFKEFKRNFYTALERKADKEALYKETDEIWKHHWGHKHNGEGLVSVKGRG